MNPVRNGMQPRAAAAYYKAPTSRASFRDDFHDALTSSLAVTGAGAAALIADGNRVGIIQQTVTAAGVDGHRIMCGQTGAARYQLGAGPLHWESELKIVTLSNGVDNVIVRAGILAVVTGITDTTDGVYFEYDFATNGDHAWRLCAKANGATTKTNTGIAATAGYQRLVLDVNQALTALVGSVSGLGTTIVAANIPGAGRSNQICVQTSKQLGAGALMVNVDYVDTYTDFNPAR